MSDTTLDTTINDLIAARWKNLPERYDKQLMILQLLHDLKNDHPEAWAEFIWQAEYDLVRNVLSGLELASRKHDRMQMHREAVEARAASIAATGHVGDARYSVREGVFASLRVMTLNEVLDQRNHCNLVAAGAKTQAARWQTIADRMEEQGCTEVGQCWSDAELDDLWS